jgi:hypothetical protein
VVFTIPMTLISSPSAVSVSASTSCIRIPSFRSKLTTEEAVLSRAGLGGQLGVGIDDTSGADSDIAIVDEPAP